MDLDYICRVESVAQERRRRRGPSPSTNLATASGQGVLSAWQSRQIDWDRVSASLARRIGKAGRPEDLCMASGDVRERAELQLLLQCAPGRKVFSENSWQNTLRGAASSAVPVGNIFSGLYCNVVESNSRPRVIRRPIPPRHVIDGGPHRRTWKDSSALRAAAARAHDELHTAHSHGLGERSVGDLLVTGQDLFEWAATSNREHSQHLQLAAEEAAVATAPAFEPLLAARLSATDRDGGGSEQRYGMARASCHVFVEAPLRQLALTEVRIVNAGHVVLRASWRMCRGGGGMGPFLCPDDAIVVLPGETVSCRIIFLSEREGVFEDEFALEARAPAAVVRAGRADDEPGSPFLIVFVASGSSGGGGGGDGGSGGRSNNGAVVTVHLRGAAMGPGDTRRPRRALVEARLRAEVAADHDEEASQAQPGPEPDQAEVLALRQEAFEWRNRAMGLHFSPQIFDSFALLAMRVQQLAAGAAEEGGGDEDAADDAEVADNGDGRGDCGSYGSSSEAASSGAEEEQWDGDVEALRHAILALAQSGGMDGSGGCGAVPALDFAEDDVPREMPVVSDGTMSSIKEGESFDNADGASIGDSGGFASGRNGGDGDGDRAGGTPTREGAAEGGAAAVDVEDAALGEDATPAPRLAEEVEDLLHEWQRLANEAVLLPLPTMEPRMAQELKRFVEEASELLASRAPPPPTPREQQQAPPLVAASSTSAATAVSTAARPTTATAAATGKNVPGGTKSAATRATAASAVAAANGSEVDAAKLLEEESRKSSATTAVALSELLGAAIDRFEAAQHGEDTAQGPKDLRQRYPFSPLSHLKTLQPTELLGQRVLLHVAAEADVASPSFAATVDAALASVRTCLAGRPAALALLPYLPPAEECDGSDGITSSVVRSVRSWAAALEAALAMEVEFHTSVPLLVAELISLETEAGLAAPSSRIMALEQLQKPGVVPQPPPDDASATEDDEEEPIPEFCVAVEDPDLDEAAARAVVATREEARRWAESAAALGQAADIVVLDACDALVLAGGGGGGDSDDVSGAAYAAAAALPFDAARLCKACVAGPRLAANFAALARAFEAQPLKKLLQETGVGSSSSGGGSGGGLFVVLGGTSLVPRLAMLDGLLDLADVGVAVVGGVANTVLAACGYGVLPAEGDEDALSAARRLCTKARRRGVPLLLPVDLVIGDAPPFAGAAAAAEGSDASEDAAAPRGGSSETAEEEEAINAEEYPGETADVAVADGVPSGWHALDVGPRTVSRAAEASRRAAVILWAGLAGVAEYAAFQEGTRALAVSLGRRIASESEGDDSTTDAAAAEAGAADEAEQEGSGGSDAEEEAEDQEGDGQPEEEQEKAGKSRGDSGGSPSVPVVVCGSRTLDWVRRALQEAAEDGDEDADSSREWLACGSPALCRAILAGRLPALRCLDERAAEEQGGGWEVREGKGEGGAYGEEEVGSNGGSEASFGETSLKES